MVTASTSIAPFPGVITEEVRISYDPATGHTTLDDRWTSAGGSPRGGVGVYFEPYGQAGAESTVMLYEALGRSVQFDVVDAGSSDQLGPAPEGVTSRGA